MKKTVPVLLLNLLMFGSFKLMAQSWVIGGNNLSASSSFGSNTNFSVIFKTNNTERARLTGSGFFGIGTNNPNSKLHVNSATGVDALRVQVNSQSKLFVHSGGGVSVGGGTIPPANGLYVAGNTGIGTSAPGVKLHVQGGSDASLASGSGFFETGPTSAANIIIDDNEIMARNNGLASTLSLNNEGGNLIINGTNTGFGSNIGINTSSPVSDIHVVHTNGFISNGLTLKNTFLSGLSWNIYSATTDELWFSNDGTLRASIDGTSGAYTPLSDRRLKKDIVSMEKVLEKVMKLSPQQYHFNSQKQSDARKYIGLIAQDVQPIFPEAVYEHSGMNDGTDDYLSMDYSAFGVISIKAIQEQQQTIQEQQAKISNLEDRITKLEAALNEITGNLDLEKSSGVLLEQNSPNPFKETTFLRYKIPGNSKAQLNIYDVSGKLVKSMNAPASGQARINGNELKAGTYTYTLLVNGKPASSKKMVLLK